MSSKQTSWMAIGIIGLVILIDQAIKLYIKCNYLPYSEVADWQVLLISFVENEGMAFGLKLPKLALTLFRLVAVGALMWYIHTLIKKGARVAYVAVLALVTAGALGNLIDCLFYGLIFSDPVGYTPAALLPISEWHWDQLCYGKVVDMVQFSLIREGKHVIFFSPVCNFADSCITVGVGALILFFRKELNEAFSSEEKEGKKK